jgi:hypothetical protein
MENAHVILSADEGWRRDALKHVAAQLAFNHRAAEDVLRNARALRPSCMLNVAINVLIFRPAEMSA